MSVDFDMKIDGLDAFIMQIEMLDKKAPSELAKAKDKVASAVLADVVENTPVDTGTLKNSWNIREVNQHETTIYNNAVNKGEFYAWDVEYGHRVKSKSGWVRLSGGGIRYVKGVFMLRDAFERGSKLLEKEANVTIERLMKE